MGQYPLIEAFIADQAQSGNILKMGKLGIRTFGWGQNYYIDEAGNKINNNPNISYYYDNKGNIQYFGKPQIDWTKVKYGQNPFETPGTLLSNETILNQPIGNQPTVTQPTINQPTINQPITNIPTMNQPLIDTTNYQLKEDNYRLPEWTGNIEYNSWLKNWKKQYFK